MNADNLLLSPQQHIDDVLRLAAEGSNVAKFFRPLAGLMVVDSTLSACGFFPSGSASAQSTSGTLIGQVFDSSSKPIADAKVTIVNENNGNARATRTNASGTYSVPFLVPGFNHHCIARRILRRSDYRISNSPQLYFGAQAARHNASRDNDNRAGADATNTPARTLPRSLNLKL